MDDFFKTIFDDALQRGTLDPDSDPDYRAARDALDGLLAALIPDEDRRDDLKCAICRLAACSDLVNLAHGFRLSLRVTAPASPVYPAPAGTVPHFYFVCP